MNPYMAWLNAMMANHKRGQVQVGNYCWTCEHGSCPPTQAQAPVKADCSVLISGQYKADHAYICFYDMVGLCQVCHVLYDNDQEWCRWLQDQYTDWKAKGAV